MSRAAVGSLLSRLLGLSLWASGGVGLIAVAWGSVVIADSRGQDWDRLGLFVGGLMAVGGLVWCLPHLILARWLARSRRGGRPLARVGAVSAALAAGLLELLLYVDADAARLSTLLLVPISGCVLVLMAGLVVVVAQT